MSGGHFNYRNDDLADEIFDCVTVNYGLERLEEASEIAAGENPLEDHEISQLVFDVFCLLHSFDWYKSCDTGYDCYKADVEYFKKKWLSKSKKERLDRLTEMAIKRIQEAADEEIKELKNIES